MEFSTPLITGRLIRRYKRFLADVVLDDGQVVTAHCPNTGSMTGCQGPDWPVCLSPANNPQRKLKYTLELVHNGSCWIGVNTQVPNRLVAHAVAAQQVPELTGYPTVKREVRWGQRSRIDLMLSDDSRRCYVEIKSVTLTDADGWYRFPDARSERGQRHLEELIDITQAGHRAVIFFLAQRSDGQVFGPADDIDPQYGATLRKASQAGVELLVYGTKITPESVTLAGAIPYQL